MSSISALKTWSLNEELTSADLNSNFSEIRTKVNTYVPFKDATNTISAVWTFSAAPVFSTAIGVGGTLTVSTGGASITGGLTIVTSGLTVSAGGAAITGNATVSGLAVIAGALTGASLNTAGALNVTGVSTLTGNVSMGGTLTVTGQTTAGSYVGIGTGLTALSAANITAGGTLPALNGSALTALNGTEVTSGTVAAARIASDLGNKTVRYLTLGPVTGGELGVIAFDAGAAASGSNSFAAFSGSIAPAASYTTWNWVKVVHPSAPGSTCYMPVLCP